MPPDSSNSHAALLVEKLAESLSSPIPDSTPRRVAGPVRLEGKATAVVGMRRAGKTTFLHQVRRQRVEDGWEPSRLPYLNFEDERLAGLEASHLSPLLEQYYRLHPHARGKDTIMWCFDEIQGVPGWERFVRRLLDTEDVEVFVTGSSAALLSREIATSLRGRAWEVLIHCFGFEEMLRHRAVAWPARVALASPRERSALERAFLAYLEAGGFPEAQGVDTATRRQLLRDYVDVAILRDVVERHGVTHVVGLRWLVRHLLGNAGSLFSVEKFFAAMKSQGLAIAKDTIHQLLAYLEDCFLVRLVWIEARSERQRMVNPRKAYPVDSGLIPVFDRTGRANLGHALETAVLVELERRRCEVTYVRTPSGHEVDFLARFPDGAEELIQVCADTTSEATFARELRALQEAQEVHTRATCRLLTLYRDVTPRELPRELVVQPAYEWMLPQAGSPR